MSEATLELEHAAAAPPADDVDAAFRAALEQEAHTAPPEIPSPPRQTPSADPEAPHGRDEHGEPLAPYGYNKKTGLPNRVPGGPGRGRRDRPRTAPAPKAAAAAKPQAGEGKAAAAAYARDLEGLAATVWIGASAIQGGRLPLLGIKLPDLQPFAYVWHQESPKMAAAWGQAAASNATVRGWVDKLAGDDSWQWLIAVGLTSANFLAACTELAKPERADLRAQLAAANGEALAAFLAAQVEQATGEPAEQAAA